MARTPPIPPAGRTKKGPGAVTEKGVKGTGAGAKQARAADHRQTSRHTTSHSSKKGSP